jgi:hypothetical protein
MLKHGVSSSVIDSVIIQKFRACHPFRAKAHLILVGLLPMLKHRVSSSVIDSVIIQKFRACHPFRAKALSTFVLHPTLKYGVL